jgi:hypothetical protein
MAIELPRWVRPFWIKKSTSKEFDLSQIKDYPSKFAGSDEHLIEAHLKFGKECFDDEFKRAVNIEQKAGQIIAQSGMVITLSLIGVPGLIKIFLDTGGLGEGKWIAVEALAAFTLLVGFIFLIISVYFGGKTLLPRDYSYPDYNKIFESGGTKVDFMFAAIQDYAESAGKNTIIDDEKARIVSKAQKFFRNALLILSFAILTLYISLVFKSVEYKKKEDVLVKTETGILTRAILNAIEIKSKNASKNNPIDTLKLKNSSRLP